MFGASAFGVAAYGSAGTLGTPIDLAVTLPLPSMSLSGTIGVGGTLKLDVPFIEVSFDAYAGVIGDLVIELPSFELLIEGGTYSLDVALPKLEAEFAGVIGVVGALDITLPTVFSEFDGLLGAVGELRVTLPTTAVGFDAVLGLHGDVDIALPSIGLRFDSLLGVSGELDVQLPSHAWEFGGSPALIGSLNVRLPSLSVLLFTGEELGAHVVTYAVNTKTKAASEFSNYTFNSFATIGGKYYGSTDAGLFVLEDGQLDDTAFITATQRTGQYDFKSMLLKRISNFLLAMRAEGVMTLRVRADEGEWYEYEVNPLDIATLRQRRSPVGKGIRGRYFEFELENTDGCDFDFDAYIVDVVSSTRRL